MAKPRIFISSTYYDLKHVRASIEAFITSLGYEPILFENGDIPFHHDQPLDRSCYDAVEGAHVFVLIIGGRYGSPSTKGAPAAESLEQKDDAWLFYNSVTVEEYKIARERDIPIYIFLEKGVAAEYLTYKKNRELAGICFAHVDNVNIFKLIDSIYAASRNNLVKEFDQVEQITHWLRLQWAGLFADYLSRRKEDATLREISFQVNNLNQVVDALKTYSEAIVRRVESDKGASEKIIEEVESKLARDLISQNKLLSYLQKNIKDDSGNSVSDELMIEAIIDSDDIKEFINSFEAPDQLTETINKFLNSASREYEIVRRGLYSISSLRPKFEAPPYKRSDSHNADQIINIDSNSIDRYERRKSDRDRPNYPPAPPLPPRRGKKQ